MKVHILGKWATPWQNGKLIYEEARRQNLKVSLGVLEQPHKTILRTIDSEKPDWVFITGSRTLPVEMLAEIKQRAKLLLWDADANSIDRRTTWRERLHIPDIIVTSVLAIAQEYKNDANRVVWMPQYFDQAYYRATIPVDRKYDILFLGGLDKRREEILTALSHKYSVAYHCKLFGEEMANAYNQAKIALGINWAETSYEYSGPFTTSDRMFKAMGCGAFYLIEPVQNLELVFEQGKHLDVYDGSQKQLFEKVEYWLQNVDDRENVAAAGQLEVLQNHTLSVRIRQYWNLMTDVNYIPPFGGRDPLK